MLISLFFRAVFTYEAQTPVLKLAETGGKSTALAGLSLSLLATTFAEC